MKIKVAILSKNFSKTGGGAESFAVQLAIAMRHECEITIISHSMSVPDEWKGVFQHIAVPRLPIRSRWINHLWFNWFTKKVTRNNDIAHHRFDIVHSHEMVTHGNVHTIHVKTVHASLKEKKIGFLQIATSPRLLAYLWLEKNRLCAKGHHSVFVSQLLLDETQAVLPHVYDGQFIPPGVTVAKGYVTKEEKTAARHTLNITPSKITIGFVGHDFKKKGLPTLLEAVALLPFDVQIIVIGNPAQAAHYGHLVEKLGAGKECHFLGVQDNMLTIYQAMDYLAHPTTQDVFPMVVLEAMAQGVPVITTVAPFNTMADLLTDHKDVLLMKDPHDAKALAAALERMQKDNDLRTQLIENGYQFAKKYNWDSVKDSYLAIYKKIIHKI